MENNFSNSEQNNFADGKNGPATAPSAKCINGCSESFFFTRQVTLCKDALLKERLRTLIKSKGMSEADFYHSIGVSKQNWYSYSWGLWQPNIEMKIKIATALGCDSCLIWQEKKSNG